MINYALNLWNLGICPLCKESNAFLNRKTGIVACTDCNHTWVDEGEFIADQTEMIRAHWLSGERRSMNRQETQGVYNPSGELIGLKGGIEWTARIIEMSKIRKGYTSNTVTGCFHDCKWAMPDGSIALCYAKTVAERVAGAAYPHGFEHMYWYPNRLYDAIRIPESHRIFIDSMSDLFGHWVDKGKVFCVLRAVEDSYQHDYLSLTKNPRRMLQFRGYLPSNLWAGFSSPPDWFMGKRLNRKQQEKILRVGLETLLKLGQPVTWVSFEPLSWDVSKIVAEYPGALKWAVIGAASNGPAYYQPRPADVQNLLDVLDQQGVKVFFKGNLNWEPARFEFPN